MPIGVTVVQGDAVPGSACHEGCGNVGYQRHLCYPTVCRCKDARVLSAHKNMRGIAGIECEDVNLRIAGRIRNS